MPEFASVRAVRFITPLREGGSLPGLVEADDGACYVVKFRGAGQGPKALVAELIVGELARALGLAVPRLVRVELPEELGRNEGDPEVRALLLASAGTNVGLAFLPQALMFDPAADRWPDAATASGIVALDAFAMNVDRTARNPNLLWSGDTLYCIDHGAALYWHHDWDGGSQGFDRPFPLVRQHVLLSRADALPQAMAALRQRLTDAAIADAVAAVPPDWRLGIAADAYVHFLVARRDSTAFEQEALRARQAL